VTREPVARAVTVAGKRLETVRWDGDPSRPAIVMLHEGLGSVSLWRDLPQRLCERTRCTVVAYSRYGYGRSDVLREKREPEYMHHEGEVVLPALLAELGVEQPILYGHSDGASIALIFAGAQPDAVRALVLEAPHVFVEDLSVRSIAAAKAAYATTDLPAKLARHHADADATFSGWNDIWLDPRFRDWNIEAYAANVRCPVLMIQGDVDEYGTTAQLDAIAARVPRSETLIVPLAGHSPHRDAQKAVLDRIAAFVDAVAPELGAVTVGDLVASFRGDVYGTSPAMTAEWFRDHVARNDVDLARSPRWAVDGELSGAALLAFRGERAWVGAFGVVPAFRGRGLAGRYLDRTVALARAGGATTVELEVLEHNAGAIRLYERGGFQQIGELIVWTRAPLGDGHATAAADARDAAELEAFVRAPATCWQRELRSVLAASPFETFVAGAAAAPDAYAFVRRGPDRAALLDAGARDLASARALLGVLDTRVRDQPLMLVNEPPHGPLHDALAAHGGWRELARQRRMRIDLR